MATTMPPLIPPGDVPDGTETVVARQKGALRRFSLAALSPIFKAPSPWVDMGIVTISETMALAVGASVRTVRVNCKGLVAGAPVTVFPAASMPTGFGISGAVSLVNDTVDIAVTCPALALGAKYSVSARVLVARV